MRSLLKAVSIMVDLVSLVGCVLIAYAGLNAALLMGGVITPGQSMLGDHVAPDLSRCIYFLILGAALLLLTQYAQRKIKRGIAALDADAAAHYHHRKRL